MIEHRFQRIHSFRDPIHAFIRVSQEERELIDSSVFQRLRRIRQLGTGYLVYHGAEHSRFGHSLGVMEIATKVFNAIRRRRQDLLTSPEEWERYEQILRLAALLHDVGHAPFSHASEDIFPREPESGKQFKHEDYTRAIIVNSELASIINSRFADMGITTEAVVNVYSDNPAALGPVGVLLQDIVAGELDADRMDYLARDSLYAGVTYGRYDLERLLDTITAVEDREGALHLAVEDGGLHALEAFLLARYFMFLQVYLHEDRRFYDFALNQTIRRLLGGDGKYPLPDSWQSFVNLDDIWILSDLQGLAEEGHIWARCLHERHHWKVVASLDERDLTVDQIAWANAQRDVCEEYGPDVAIVDDARASTFQRTDLRPYITEHAETQERPKILVLSRDGRTSELVEVRSEIVRELSKRRVRFRRVYACPDQREEVLSSWNAALRRHS